MPGYPESSAGAATSLQRADNDAPYALPSDFTAEHAKRRDSMHPAVHLAQMIRAIETEIVPRLVNAAHTTPPAASDAQGLGLSDQEIEDYALQLTKRDPAAAEGFLARLRNSGVSAEALLTGLLTPAARQLGTMWEDDLCDFTQVTIGVVRLQQVVHALSPAFQGDGVRTDLTRRILLLPAPGEQHTFGLLILSEFFRRAGWHVWGGGGPATGAGSPTDLVAAVAFAVVGISAGTTAVVDKLSMFIHAIRRASCNPDIGIIVGGPLFLAHPELVARVGADATGADAAQAVQRAEALLELRMHRV